MSRIDQALNRASSPALGEVGAHGSVTAVDERHPLDAYVVEVAEHKRNRELPAPPASERVVDLRPEPPVRPVVPPATPRRRHAAAPDAAYKGKLLGAGFAWPAAAAPYERLAGALCALQRERALRTLLVTSALAGEGKTLTVSNLALTLSESFSCRVLLVDANPRQPALHRVFGLPNAVGLADLLQAERRDSPVISLSDRLSVLPAGRPDFNTCSALTSARMEELVDDLATRYDWVLLDSAPVVSMRDASLLSRIARAVLLVIRANGTPYPSVHRTIATLGSENVIGTVLNRMLPPSV